MTTNSCGTSKAQPAAQTDEGNLANTPTYIEVSEKGVLELLQNLRPNNATGPDSNTTLLAFILKTGAKELSPVLTIIFQRSLCAGQVPSD